MKVIYVAGPITIGDIDRNLYQACRAGLELIRAGLCPVVPHLSCFMGLRPFYGAKTHPLVSARRSYVPEVQPEGTSYDQWISVSVATVRRCDALLRLPGESRGADLEERIARDAGMPVFMKVEEVKKWAAWEDMG